VEGQCDHSDERGDGRLPRKEAGDALRPAAINANVNGLTDRSPTHVPNRTESVTQLQLARHRAGVLEP
jgi:hypothetical protein